MAFDPKRVKVIDVQPYDHNGFKLATAIAEHTDLFGDKEYIVWTSVNLNDRWLHGQPVSFNQNKTEVVVPGFGFMLKTIEVYQH